MLFLWAMVVNLHVVKEMRQMERSRTEHGWVWMVASWPPARRKASGLWGIRAMLFFFLIFSAGAMFSKKQQQKSRTWKLRTLINSTFFGGLLSVLKAQVLYFTLRGCEIFGPKSFTKVQMWRFLFFFCLGGRGRPTTCAVLVPWWKPLCMEG